MCGEHEIYSRITMQKKKKWIVMKKLVPLIFLFQFVIDRNVNGELHER